MKNICFAILYCLTFSLAGNAQSFKTSKIIIDKASKQPLAYVNVYNDKDNSVSNADGVFVFVSSKNEINFSFIGYNTLTTTFEAVAKQDTIFMDAKSLELKEVVISNITPFMKKVYDSMNENILSNYTIDFFLRNVLKKDDSIIKLQDIYGKKEKLAIANPKKDTKIEVLNMRKTGILEKHTPDLNFPDFNEFLTPPVLALDKCNFTDEDYNDIAYKKISFQAKEKDGWGQTWNGYFIVNRKDYAVVEYFISAYDNPEVVPYKKTFLGTRYRTAKYQRLIKVNKDKNTGKYYLNQSRLDAQVEGFADKRIGKAILYNLTMDYFTTAAPTNEPVNANFSVDKDIFKAKFDYSADFWDNQNQLPLTQELKNFLKRVAANKDKKKEYEVIGNF
jgi:CarboxypepD_reg-like domain